MIFGMKSLFSQYLKPREATCWNWSSSCFFSQGSTMKFLDHHPLKVRRYNRRSRALTKVTSSYTIISLWKKQCGCSSNYSDTIAIGKKWSVAKINFNNSSKVNKSLFKSDTMKYFISLLKRLKKAFYLVNLVDETVLSLEKYL